MEKQAVYESRDFPSRNPSAKLLSPLHSVGQKKGPKSAHHVPLARLIVPQRFPAPPLSIATPFKRLDLKNFPTLQDLKTLPWEEDPRTGRIKPRPRRKREPGQELKRPPKRRRDWKCSHWAWSTGLTAGWHHARNMHLKSFHPEKFEEHQASAKPWQVATRRLTKEDKVSWRCPVPGRKVGIAEDPRFRRIWPLGLRLFWVVCLNTPLGNAGLL